MSLLSRTTNFISHIATFIYNSVVGLVTCILSIPSLILYYSPILLPSAFFIATFFIPQLYLPFLATMGILTTLAIYSDLSLFKATPKRDVLSDFTKRFQELVSYLTIYRRNDWLKKEGTNNLTEYYHKLRNANDLTSEALSLSYDAWFDTYHQGKEKNWKMWRRWDLAKRLQNLDITDDVVHATNHYKEDMSPRVFHIKHHNPKVKDNKKHLVVFLGRRLSAEDRIDELNYLANNTGMTIHVMNYPDINDSKGMVYTEQDLTNCGRALVENLITKKSIAAKDIVLFGNCLGSSIAESTFQDFKQRGINLSGRILSNNYGYFKPGVRRILISNVETLLYPLRSLSPWKRNIAFYTLSVVFSPLILMLLIIVELLPLFGWKNSPAQTAKNQDVDALLLGRHDDGILTGKTRHIDNINQNNLADLKAKYLDLSKRDNFAHYKKLKDKPQPKNVAILTQGKEHWLARSIDLLTEQCKCQDLMLTPETYANKGRMQNIVWEPHMADFSDMGVRVQPNSSKLQKGGDQPIMALFKAQTELQDIQNNRRCIYNFFTSHRKKIHDEYVKAKKAGTSGKNSPLIKPKRTQ